MSVVYLHSVSSPKILGLSVDRKNISRVTIESYCVVCGRALESLRQHSCFTHGKSMRRREIVEASYWDQEWRFECGARVLFARHSYCPQVLAFSHASGQRSCIGSQVTVFT